MLSRETTFLANNVILVVITFTIFLGTIFPVLAEAVRGVKVSVGAPFFNKVTVPLAYALLVLMGIGPLIAWRRASWDNLKRNFTYPTLAALAIAAEYTVLDTQSLRPDLLQRLRLRDGNDRL